MEPNNDSLPEEYDEYIDANEEEATYNVVDLEAAINEMSEPTTVDDTTDLF